MRWDNLLTDSDPEEERHRLPLFADEAVVRRFKTPEFRGITFYEVQARSIINHVPGDRFGFNWTINTFRGCSHSCSYCAVGETPILMGDGRTRSLADLRVGDEIYGTERIGNYRRFVKTRVSAHWATLKPAFRITLQDGTELITSGDHRFWTSPRGRWKFVTGKEQGRERRPHLTLNDSLSGTGRFASPPIESVDYKRGYLCGMIRGDAWLASQFRLALVDTEGLRRTRQYLAELEVETSEFVFQQAVGQRKQVNGIRASGQRAIGVIENAICWPMRPTRKWHKGFLAGIFDAEGSYTGTGSLRISNTDPELINQIISSVRKLGFFYVLETRKGTTKPVYCVRVLGGVQEALRFFHTVDPAITRKRSIEGQAIKNDARLKVVSIEPLGVDLPMYDITTGTGDFIANGVVSHNCFARPTHTYLDFNAGKDFETKIVVKVNAVDLLHKELRKKSWQGELIAMGTNTDPYQRAEGHYKLMRGILTELNAARNPYSILTKGTLIQRDIDLLAEGAGVTDVSTCFSVGTVDDAVWRETEPGTPHPRKRLEVLRQLNDAGVPCGVLMAPILPGISDSPDQLRATVEAIAEAGATFLSPILLHLRPGVKEEFMPWLEDNHPELVENYENIYKRRSYAPKDVQEPVMNIVGNLKRELGYVEADRRQRRGPSEESKPVEPKASEQLTLGLHEEEKRAAPKWVTKKLAR